jgi:hypothetical protein
VITLPDRANAKRPSPVSGHDATQAEQPERCLCRRSARWLGRHAALVALITAATVLSSCGESGNVNPSRSPNLSGVPSRSATVTSAAPSEPAGQATTRVPPTRSEPPTQTQTETETQTRSENRTSTETSTRTATETRTQTAVQTPTATTKPAQATGAASSSASSSASSTPVWVWWLIGAVVLAAAIASVLLLRRRSRKHAWAEEFTLAKREVVWLAREFVPLLARAPTAQQIAGGWRIQAGRVVAIEDQLTRLEATAVDDVGRSQARTLRDAVRASRTHLGALDNAGDTATAMDLLRSTATDLETALSSVETAIQPSTGQAGPR